MRSEGLIYFIRLPSPSGGVPLISWTTPRLGFKPVETFVIDPAMISVLVSHFAWIVPGG
jgi:hypothetical protein